MPIWVTILITIIGALLGTGFLQFLITRADNQKELAKNNSADLLRKEFKENLELSNSEWKETYCDKNARMIQDLTTEVRQGLEAREAKGAERYEEHKKAIEELREAMLTLAKNTEETKKIGGYLGQALMGLTHDKLIYLGKQYQKRGAITLAEQNNLKLLYKPYHDGLGGNSDGEGYFTYCMNLPVVTDEEAMEMDKKNKEKS